MGYLTQAKELQKVLTASAANDDERVENVFQALESFRSILGQHQVSRDLTQTFRMDVEPRLSEVWTSSDLNQFSILLSNFGGELQRSLAQWADRYCREPDPNG